MTPEFSKSARFDFEQNQIDNCTYSQNEENNRCHWRSHEGTIPKESKCFWNIERQHKYWRHLTLCAFSML